MSSPTPLVRLRTSAVGRALWAIADQALSSLTNFGLAVGVARQVGTEEFGAFSIAFAAYLVALTISRSVSTDPLLIRYSTASPVAWRDATGRATGAAFAVGVLGGLIAIVASIIVGGSLGVALMVLGFGLPALLVQDAWRYAFFAVKRGRSAFVNDLAWTVALAIGFTIIVVTDQRSIGAFVLAWVGGALAGALVGVVQAGVAPDPLRARAWWHEHRDIAPRMATEAAILSGGQPVTLSLMGTIAGLATVGTIRAGNTLMNAIHIATYGIHLFAVPEAVRILARSTTALVRFCVILTLGLMAISAVWGGILLALPESIGRALLGVSWEPARTVLLPVTVLALAQSAQGGALVGLRALAAARQSLRARVISSLSISAGAIAGVVVGGAVGGAWGMAIGLALGSIYWWSQFAGAVADRRRSPADILERADDAGSPGAGAVPADVTALD